MTEALDSVAAQTEPAVQLIVTDDGSTDESVAVIDAWLADHRERFPHGAELLAAPRNIGLPANLNRALPLVRGSYFVVLNGDDWMDDDRVAVQTAALDALPSDVGVSYCDLRFVSEDGEVLAVQPPATHGGREGDVLRRMAADTFIGMPGVMARTSLLEVIGPWDESLVADDFDFLMRAAAACRFAYLPRSLINYRTVAVSLTNSRSAELAESRLRSLVTFLGRDGELDAVILPRLEDHAVMLHDSTFDRRITRRHIRAQFRRRPTWRLARVMVESHLHLPPRALAFGFLRPRLAAKRPKPDGAGGL